MFQLGFFLIFLGTTMPADLEPLPAETVVFGMPDDCEVLGFADLRGVYDRIDGLVTDLGSRSFVTGVDDVQEMISFWPTITAQARAEGTSTLGVDPFTAFHSAAGCLRFDYSTGDEPLPEFLVVLQGDFTAALGATWAGSAGVAAHALPNGVSVFGEVDDGRIIGFASPADGVLLIGTQTYLDVSLNPAVPNAWASYTQPEGSLAAELRVAATEGVRMFQSFRISEGMRGLVSAIGLPVTALELVNGLEMATYAVRSDNSVRAMADTTEAGARDYELLMLGLGDLIQAGPLVADGMLRMFLGVVSPNDHDLDSEIRDLATHRDDVVAFLAELGLGDSGTVAFEMDETTHRMALVITGANPTVVTGTLSLPLLGAVAFIAGSPSPRGESVPETAVEESMPPSYPY